MTDKILPAIKGKEFQTAEHRYSRFDCLLPAGVTQGDLENPALWVNIAPRLKMFDEVRAVAEDHSFVAYLIVTFSQGTDARLKITSGADLAGNEDIEVPTSKYEVKLRGPKKWCLMNNETGECIKEGIPKKSDAYRELEDHIAALSR
jgi:hypothetical protein